MSDRFTVPQGAEQSTEPELRDDKGSLGLAYPFELFFHDSLELFEITKRSARRLVLCESDFRPVGRFTLTSFVRGTLDNRGDSKPHFLGCEDGAIEIDGVAVIFFCKLNESGGNVVV